MPESFAALAANAVPVHQKAATSDQPSPPATPGPPLGASERDMVLKYLDLAEALAARFEARGRERADLNQVAYLGLVKAAKGFDESKGDSFPAYAAPTITGELKRYLRDRTWVVRPPRQVQDLRSRLFRAEPELTQSLGRIPSVAELAGELGTDPLDVQEAMSASSSMRPDSLDAVSPHSDAPSIGEMLASPETPLEKLEELACLRAAMKDLADSDRELLYRRYFCEETQVQLGKRLGMSQMQVSRRLAKVLAELQRRLEESAGVDGPGGDGRERVDRAVRAEREARTAPPANQVVPFRRPRKAGRPGIPGTGRLDCTGTS